MREINYTKRKILLLLMGGATLCLVRSPKQYFKVIRAISKGWQQINKEKLRNEIRRMYQSKLIATQEEKDGTLTLVLSERGKRRILKYNFDKLKIKKHPWDNKWRLVIFDIPEKFKKARDALRLKLKKLGFRELQKSVFIYPFECKNEIDFIIEFWQLKPYVRYGILESIDNDLHFKSIFNL